MKHFIITILLLILGQSLNAQNSDISIQFYQDSIFLKVEKFKLIDMKEVKRTTPFKGVSKKWTHLVEFEFQSKTYRIPIDTNVHTITIIDNKISEGFCNRVTYWTSSDSVKIYEHGNGCTDMNDVVINDRSKSSPGTLIEGTRVIPFNYK